MKTIIYKLKNNKKGINKNNFNSYKTLSLIISLLALYTLSFGSSKKCVELKFSCSPDSVKSKEPVDTNILETKNKTYIFVEYENGVTIDRIDERTGEKKRLLDVDSDDFDEKKKEDKFRGHWSGFEFGINEYAADGYSLNRPSGYEYMDLKTGSSWNFNLNFAQNSMPVIRNKVGIVTGLGIEFNSYRFHDNNNIQVSDITGNIEERVLKNDYNVKKSKFKTTYLTLPVLLEAQSSERSYISFGIIGGYNIGSAVKVKHIENGSKKKFIERKADLNLNDWRLGLTLRMGHHDKNDNSSSSGMYATYYLTPLFQTGKGPELFPFEIGFRIDM